ncbi:MAG: hypothetical protein WA884_11315 [Methyloceanibacter sp.]
MRLITAFAATAAILIAGSIVGKAEAATVSGVGGLTPLPKSYSPIEKAGCVCGPRGCACGHPYYRPYGYYHPYYRPYRYYRY